MATTVPEDVELRAATKIRQNAEKKFQEMGIAVGEPVMPPKIPVPPNGNVRLTTNLFAVKTETQIPIYRWDVEISISLRNGKTLALTKKSDSDAVSVDRKAKTRIIYEKMIENHSELFESKEHCFYDMESTLYTLQKLRKAGETDDIVFAIQGLSGEKFQGTTSATVTLKKVRDAFEINLLDFTFLTSNVDSTDLSHKQFLELVTSQVPMMSGGFITYPGGTSFSLNTNATSLPEGKYLGHGIQKSVRYVEDKETKKPMAAIAVDLKKTAFHAVKNGLDYLSDIVDTRPIWENRELPEMAFAGPLKKMKGIRAKVLYGTRYREILIHEISRRTAASAEFERNGTMTSMIAYFREVYQVEINYPKAPLAVEKKPASKELCYYPLELIEILDNQRVTGELPQKVIKDVIREAAVLPALRLRQIRESAEEIELFNNAYIQNVGTTINPQPITVEGRTLSNPRLIYKTNTIDVRSGQWGRGGPRLQFIYPATVGKWSCLMISREVNGKAFSTMSNFISTFMSEAAGRGMMIDHPTDPWPLNIRDDIESGMAEFFSQCMKMGIEFVLVLQEECFHHHKYLKYIERKYNVITQDVAIKTVYRCAQRAAATIENIVQKTNMKLGGLNYSIEMRNPDGTKSVFQDDVLYVGFAMSHSKPPKPDATGREPAKPASVVGYAANILEPAKHFAFVGDYYFQAADRDEKIDSILPIVRNILDRWTCSHQGQMPKSIIFFRNGASEGQYKNILKFEIPLIKKAIEDFRETVTEHQKYPDTKICVVVATKRHNVRIFKSNLAPGSKAPEQNLQPGIAVDRNCVHPVFAEFYVNSHTTLQGTGKTPRYTIMNNEANFKLGQLEHIIFGLAHGHQIVNLTTSLPTPVYIAQDYADRGMAVLHQYLRETQEPIDHYDRFNEELTYACMRQDSRFHTCRVNA